MARGVRGIEKRDYSIEKGKLRGGIWGTEGKQNFFTRKRGETGYVIGYRGGNKTVLRPCSRTCRQNAEKRRAVAKRGRLGPAEALIYLYSSLGEPFCKPAQKFFIGFSAEMENRDFPAAKSASSQNAGRAAGNFLGLLGVFSKSGAGAFSRQRRKAFSRKISC